MNSIGFIKKSRKIYLKKFLIIFIFLSISFTTSAPVFKYFETANSVDPKSYIKMSRGDYDVYPTHRYRFAIPEMVSILKPYIQKLNLNIFENDKNENNYNQERLGFYIVNITISSITAYYTFFYLQTLGFCSVNSLIGGILFLTNRYVIISNGAPLIDSLQYLCLILHSLFLLNKESFKISFLLPVMGITKETLIPLIFVPFFNNQKNKKLIFCSTIITIFLIVIVRNYIYSPDFELSKSLYQNFFDHLIKFPKRLSVIFSFKGILKIFSTYGIVLLFSFLGFLENKKKKDLFIPKSVIFLMPYSISLCFLSNDTGRLISIAFPVIIPYSLYFINKKILGNQLIFK